MMNDVRQQFEVFQSLFQNNPEACYAIGTDGQFFLVNRAAAELTGYSQEELLSMAFMPIIAEKDLQRVIAHFHRILAGRHEVIDLSLKHKNGSFLELRITAAPLIVNGKVEGAIGVASNMTENKRLGEELSASRNQLQTIFDNLDILSWAFDVSQQRYIHVSSAVEKIYGIPRELYASHPDYWRKQIHPEDSQRVDEAQPLLLKGQKLLLEHRIVHPDGTVKWVESHTIPIFDESRSLIRLEGVATDVTLRKEAEERLQHLAYHDALTGLPNRLLFTAKLDAAIARSRGTGNKTAVLYLDLDRFKYINDSLGHDIGDQLLQVIATRLQACAGAGDVVSRQGGDEFAIVLANVRSQEQIRLSAEKVLAAVHQPVKLFHLEFMVTTSIGISVFPDYGTDTATLLKQADQAMYVAKEKGKGHYQFFSQKLDETLARKMFLEQSLHHALKGDELLLHYQPIVDAESGELLGYEALLRWIHPTLGYVSPAELIPIAEETGLIVPIGEWVLKSACLQTKLWQSRGFPNIGVSVNISALQLMENFIPVVEKTLQQTGLAPGSLTLEITESTAMQNLTDILPKIEQLKTLGVKLSIDDFGTGYSSLSYLKKFQIHALKIDQSFVRDIEKDTNQEAIIKAVVAMADSLRIGVVAEGVETDEQIRFLRALGCRRMQGYFFSKPLPAEQMEALYFR
ncbi:putative bifunctional diguanylate cyclase/phosphodiesterase [Cohnella candidum]|nr:EAL domain-containing protein [Cohnella candidum]